MLALAGALPGGTDAEDKRFARLQKTLSDSVMSPCVMVKIMVTFICCYLFLNVTITATYLFFKCMTPDMFMLHVY